MAPQSGSAVAGEDSNNAIVVTGSRIIANGNNSPVPVTVITTDRLTDLRPTSLTESIQVLPIFSGSRSQTSNPSATGSVGGGNGVAAQLNLRNIGSNRNLILIDGRRVPPTSVGNLVDADVIPQLLIERVETVTGGVSAVYGSDAVSGVINFITNKTFTGLKAYGQVGLSEYGDGLQKSTGIAVGTSLFGGRGHFTASYEFRDDEGVEARSDRDWFRRPVVVGSGTTAAPYRLISDAVVSNLPFGGRVTCGAGCTLNGQYFAQDGVLSPFVNGTTYAGSPNTQSGGAGGYLDMSLKAAQRMHQAYGRFDYDLSDDVSLFLVGSGTFKRNSFYADDIQLQNITLNRNNAFLSPAYSALLPNQTFTFNQMNAQADPFNPIPESRQLMFTAGLSGKLGTYNWNLAYTYGDARLTTTFRNNVNNQKLSAALDAVVGVNGQPVCYAATQAATAAAYADCVPLNLFGPTASSDKALDYILGDPMYRAWTRQNNVIADISGELFDNWAGPVSAALSGEWRRQTFVSESEAAPSDFANCTNLRYNCTPANVALGTGTILYRQTLPISPFIKQSVWEVAGELNVPLLRDVPLFRSLDLNGAARYTKYDTVGSYWTWKAGLDWHVSDDLRFRGTISRDIRAPTLNDLYAPLAIVIVNNPDLLTGNTNQVPAFNRSNPNLTAEIGNTKTLGVVYKPSFVPGLSFAVDYYAIKIKDAITTVQGFAANTQNGCNLNGVALYCDQIVRDSNGVVIQWINRPINFAEVETHGVDFEVNYASNISGLPFNLRLLAAHQPHIRYIQPSVPTLDQGGVAFGPTGLTAGPSWRLTGMVDAAVTEQFKVSAMYRWRNRMDLWGDASVWAAGEGTVAPYGQVSLNLAYDVRPAPGQQLELFLNIQNLFDAVPPAANAPGSASAPGGFAGFALTDDPIGRFWTAGVRVKF